MNRLLTDSPCIAVCHLGADGYCTGCRRSVDEIAAWSELNAEDRDRINRRILQDNAHPAVRVRLLGEARGAGRRRGGRKGRRG